MLTLDKLSLNTTAQIRSVSENPFRNKLLDMGLYPGQVLKITHKAPFGDPLAVKLEDSMLMLRKAEASNIEVVELD